MSQTPETMLPRVLMIHNRYQQPGGEDFVFAQERDLLRSYGHEVDTLEFTNDDVEGLGGKLAAAWGASYNHASARKVREAIVRFRPDVVHVHNWFMVASPAVFDVSHQMGVATVASLHNFRLVCANALLMREGAPCEKCLHLAFPWHGVRHGCYRGSALQSAVVGWATSASRARGTWARVDRVIALSAFQRETLLRSALGVTSDQLALKGNFISDPGARDPAAQRDAGVLFAGRLAPEKGIRVLLEAAALLPSEKFTVVGSGPLESEVQQATSALTNVTWHPHLPRPQVLELLRRAQVAVVPSVWYEIFPMAVLEAYASATPVVASDIGSLRELIVEGETGARFTPGSGQHLAQVLAQVLPTANELGRRARAHYLRHHTPDANYPKLAAIYSAAIASATSAKSRIS
jgi:glycosyltransferase involved in cell wall biosynthesis